MSGAAPPAWTFAAGFTRGADPLSATRRHIIDDQHEHWLARHAAGQRAADHAAARYLGDRLLLSTGAVTWHLDARALVRAVLLRDRRDAARAEPAAAV